MVHRDLKPSNVLLRTGLDGAPVALVTDFGVARHLTRDMTRHTRTIGTYAYMAPEQLLRPRSVDRRADIFSTLGALIAGRALNALRRKLDPRNINGGVFLGLNGIVIKSHGGTDEVGFKSALGLAYEMARARLIDKISDGMRRFPAFPAAPEAVPADREAKPA